MELKPYGDTAARKPFEKKERYSSSKTIDAHCHLHVQEAADLVTGIYDPGFVPATKFTN